MLTRGGIYSPRIVIGCSVRLDYILPSLAAICNRLEPFIFSDANAVAFTSFAAGLDDSVCNSTGPFIPLYGRYGRALGENLVRFERFVSLVVGLLNRFGTGGVECKEGVGGLLCNYAPIEVSVPLSAGNEVLIAQLTL